MRGYHGDQAQGEEDGSFHRGGCRRLVCGYVSVACRCGLGVRRGAGCWSLSSCRVGCSLSLGAPIRARNICLRGDPNVQARSPDSTAVSDRFGCQGSTLVQAGGCSAGCDTSHPASTRVHTTARTTGTRTRARPPRPPTPLVWRSQPLALARRAPLPSPARAPHWRRRRGGARPAARLARGNPLVAAPRPPPRHATLVLTAPSPCLLRSLVAAFALRSNILLFRPVPL